MVKSLRQVILGLVVVTTGCAAPAPGPLLEEGVSESLARHRKASLEDLTYDYELSVPLDQSALTGTLRTRFTLLDHTEQPLVIDFKDAAQRVRSVSVNGTPADCVTLAVCNLLETTVPALVVSGINKGWNLGDDVTNSGTVAGALEGMLHGIPSMAVSLEDCSRASYAVAANYAVQLAERILKSGLPEGTILNVNVPGSKKEAIAGIQFTSLSQRRYHKPVVEKIDPRGGSYFWIAGERQSWARKKPSDHDAVEMNMVSVSPLHLDLTDYLALNTLKSWGKSLSTGKSCSVAAPRRENKVNRGKT